MKIFILFFVLISLGFSQEPGARYLIITPDNFYNDILPLAIWKHKKGMRTKIAKLSETGYSTSEIRNYIVNCYNNWQIKPEYILFVGAPNLIPFPLVLGWNSDNYYTNMDNDLYNEILSGRLTVHNTTELQTVVKKILMYERTPYTNDSLWFKRACLIANEDYGYYPPIGNDTVYWNDVRYARNLMLANGYNLIDTLSKGLGNNYNSVYQSINNGRAFLMYRGTGLGNWYSPFDCNPDATANGPKLPIVLSITCRTISTGSTPCTAEKWLLTGTPTNLRGGAGFFATTTVGGGYITFLRSAVARGFFDGIFVQKKRTFGEACEAGRLRVDSLYHYSGGDEEYVGFTTVGDPEMNIWTDVPCSLIVNHPIFLPLGGANFTVNVIKAQNHIPVESAFVCIAGMQDTNIYVLNTTDNNGDARFIISPAILNDTIYVTVTGRNLKPYEGYMIVRTIETPYVIYLKSIIDDFIFGNNNHIINPGEIINLPLWVKNLGDSLAQDVTGILRTNDQYILIQDSVKFFGDIPGGDSSWTGNNGYLFTVAPECPDLHSINFQLLCRDANDSVWNSNFTHRVFAPHLIFQEALISGGNGNNNLEPGETVYVKVKIKNIGHSPVDSINAILESFSNYAFVIDSLGFYEHIGCDSMAINDSNLFVIYADSSTPQGTSVDFRVILSSYLYEDTIQFSLVIGKKDYYIWNPDPTPVPGQNMHNILTNLGYSGEIGLNLPDELRTYCVVFVCLGVFPNNYVIQENSPEALRLVDFANNGGKIYMEGGDVWYYDPTMGGHDFSNLFGIYPDDDGGSDMGPIQGISGSFTDGMLFNYAGENEWMDHISPSSLGSFLIFRDTDNNFNCGVAYDADVYRTVATSFELGLLVDGTPPSDRVSLLDSIMHFFGIRVGIEEIQNPRLQLISSNLSVYPNPFRKSLIIRYTIQDTGGMIQDAGYTIPDISLKIYDVSGRIVKSFNLESCIMNHESAIFWNGTDNSGRKLPSGVYFVRLETEDFKKTEKVILLR